MDSTAEEVVTVIVVEAGTHGERGDGVTGEGLGTGEETGVTCKGAGARGTLKTGAGSRTKESSGGKTEKESENLRAGRRVENPGGGEAMVLGG